MRLPMAPPNIKEIQISKPFGVVFCDSLYKYQAMPVTATSLNNERISLP